MLQKGVDLSLFQRFLLNLLVVSVHKLLIKAFFHLVGKMILDNEVISQPSLEQQLIDFVRMRCNRLLRFIGLAID